MKAIDLYKGVIVPMITPLTGSLEIDRKAVSTIIDSFIGNNVSPFILGTTGEAASLSLRQKRDLVKMVCQCVNHRVLVYAGVSGNCLSDQIDEGVDFAEMGVDVLVSLPPYYYPMNQEQMLNYFTALADALPKPLILYNMPLITRHRIPLEVVQELSYHKNIVGIKDSERDETRLFKAIGNFKNRDDFVFLTGWTSKSYDALIHGSEGIVPSTGNLTPELCQELYMAVRREDFSTAVKIQNSINSVSSLFQEQRILSQSIPALKFLMSIKGLCSEHVMPPMYDMKGREAQGFRESMTKELKKLGVL